MLGFRVAAGAARSPEPSARRAGGRRSRGPVHAREVRSTWERACAGRRASLRRTAREGRERPAGRRVKASERPVKRCARKNTVRACCARVRTWEEAACSRTDARGGDAHGGTAAA